MYMHVVHVHVYTSTVNTCTYGDKIKVTTCTHHTLYMYMYMYSVLYSVHIIMQIHILNVRVTHAWHLSSHLWKRSTAHSSSIEEYTTHPQQPEREREREKETERDRERGGRPMVINNDYKSQQ